MPLSIDTRREVQSKLQQWNKEAAMHFCGLAQRGARFTNVVYPTGLRMVIAEISGERAEVPLRQAKELRSAGYKFAA